MQGTLNDEIFWKAVRAKDFDQARSFVGQLMASSTKERQEAGRGLLGVLRSLEDASVSQADPWVSYWNTRKDYVYLLVCRRLIEIVSPSAQSIVDIGSNRTPVLEWAPHVKKRYSVDPQTPYVAPGITSIYEDFLAWDPQERFNIGLCFQVMEHIPDQYVTEFARKLLTLCDISIVSVPFRERPGVNPGHLQSRIDLRRIRTWFGRPPNFRYVAKELAGDKRLVVLFDRSTERKFKSMDPMSFHALKYRYRWSLTGSGFEQFEKMPGRSESGMLTASSDMESAPRG